MERRIYSSWAFTENEREKAEINREIYKELMGKYKVYRNDIQMDLKDGESLKFEDYDVVIGRKPGYHHALYRVHKNAPGLSIEELALLCDHGNLCFGYSRQGELICVSED